MKVRFVGMDAVLHYARELGGLGTVVGRDGVVEGSLMRIAGTPQHVGQAEDVVWEARGDDAFLSSHLVFSSDEHVLDGRRLRIRKRTVANCLYRRGRMVEEWVVRDELAECLQRGLDPDEVARGQLFRGYTGSMTQPPPSDVLAEGDSGPRPDDHRGECRLHRLHFTAEVFVNFGGDYQLRWGADGTQGEYRSVDGDVVSVPTWIFRGFTNVGDDEGVLLTVLGGDDTGGIIWGPSVLREAAGHGLHLTADNRLVDTVRGERVPDGVALVTPMSPAEIDRLDAVGPDQFRARVTHAADRVWATEPFLCSALPGGGAELSLVIGYGMSEDRRATPRLHDPHGFDLAWLRAAVGGGVLTHRHPGTQVLTAKAGRWVVRLNTGAAEQTVELGPLDTLSVPAGAWRSFTLLDAAPGRAADPGLGELLVVNGGDGRTELEWAPEVVTAARHAGRVLDANGYVAPAEVLVTATDDD